MGNGTNTGGTTVGINTEQYQTGYYKQLVKEAQPPKDYAEPVPHGQIVEKHVEKLLQLFSNLIKDERLSEEDRAVALLFHDVAYSVVATVPRNQLRTHALNHLVVAMEAAIKAKRWNEDWAG